VISGAGAMLLRPAATDAPTDVCSIGAKTARLNERPERRNGCPTTPQEDAERNPNAREGHGPAGPKIDLQICSQSTRHLVQYCQIVPMREHARAAFA